MITEVIIIIISWYLVGLVSAFLGEYFYGEEDITGKSILLGIKIACFGPILTVIIIVYPIIVWWDNNISIEDFKNKVFIKRKKK